MYSNNSVDFQTELDRIDDLLGKLNIKLHEYWKDNIEVAELQLNIKDTADIKSDNVIKKLDTLDLRNQFKLKFPDEDLSNLKGIYMIYRNNELFYIGEGKILSRLRRHCNKPYRKILSPRIKPFEKILEDELYVIVFKMKNPEHDRQRILFETILTAHLLPKYMMDVF
ncbi:hypothetical protein [Jeotgalicoccus psychrophilus]|uniref:hypothetical protein n=1 Tax=Jeotgalicoccus psychrophilus TaxID=157228 RepID=UPI00041BFA72|nr:hypothetical protein [Jeotgalicoccus psychrophilus]